ncbi:MAG: serine O-acetyltransferase [Rickettsiales bacterium]|nr:serine O-acetyltransferase [Rickettsiales bacterium]|tara:strand:- start:23 stop:679 length:657 start_codon:yes stop_codon:yes gene_type:complete
MFTTLKSEIDSYFDRDPAARSRLEVCLVYPGFHAMVLYRPAHWLWQNGWFLVARCLMHIARMVTGIEIHPAATIGKGLFIDHGHGVVIGETACIGDHVTLYHGVTLGGISLKQEIRHPQVGNDVIIGAGAQVLGPVTIGEGARIGANAVVVRDVAAHTSVVGIPAHTVKTADEAFTAYGTPQDVTDEDHVRLAQLEEEVRLMKESLALLVRRNKEKTE